MKVALFGGTFDPVHKGHLNAAKEVIRQHLVNEVWFITAKLHAFKENSSVTAFLHRKRMIEFAIRGIEGLKAIDLNENPTYTIDTILKAKERFPGVRFFWLMGANLVDEFPSWKEPKRILSETKLILFPVPGSGLQKNRLIERSSPIRVKAKAIDLSSTLVRKRLAEGKGVSGLLSKAVLAYIKENNLYLNNK